MNVDVDKLNDFSTFEVVHGCGLYRAYLTRAFSSDRPYTLEVYYVAESGMKYKEFSGKYKTAYLALKKLKRYFKGEQTEWNLL